MMAAKLHGHIYDVVVIGGGAAGVGVSVALKDAGIDNFVVVERFTIGASFALWPAETRFITPSFATNSVGMLDLNAIAIGSSAAHVLGVEHPTGEEYETYLRALAQYFELPIHQHIEVHKIAEQGDSFHVHTTAGIVHTKHVIWATGEFQFPRVRGFVGSDLCRHTATIESYRGLPGEDFIIVGGYESGVDAAYHLARRGKQVRLFDRGCPWEDESSDPSVALSTYSRERMRDPQFVANVELFAHTPIAEVERVGAVYNATTHDGKQFQTSVPPLLAVGFGRGHPRIAHLFARRDDGYPLLSEHDESTIVPGIFLCGPAVRHDNQVFCFIYKYRQRFAVVAKAIATSLGLPAQGLEVYRNWGMYLDDLSCCGQECVC